MLNMCYKRRHLITRDTKCSSTFLKCPFSLSMRSSIDGGFGKEKARMLETSKGIEV
jgi:hypothetical protein